MSIYIYIVAFRKSIYCVFVTQSQFFLLKYLYQIRVITKLPNTEQSSKVKGKTHKSKNRQKQLKTGKLGKPQWP